MVEIVIHCFNLSEDLFIGIAIERWHPRDHDVENDSDGPDIDLGASNAIKRFWSHIVGRTLDTADFLALGRRVGLCETEVNQAHHIVIIDHDVLRLYVPMDDV